MLLSLPLRVPVSKKKHFLLNLNAYRNAHHMVLNKAKVNFGELVKNQVQALPVMDKVALSYTLFPGTRHKMDISNICSVVDKFFCDVLVKEGRLPDDNYEHVLGVQYLFGQYDKGNGRVEVKIERH